MLSRARAIFGLSDVILVTQAFHLPRALFLCESLGLHAIGVASDLRAYRRSSQTIWAARELFATAAAVWDVVVSRAPCRCWEAKPIE